MVEKERRGKSGRKELRGRMKKDEARLSNPDENNCKNKFTISFKLKLKFYVSWCEKQWLKI